MTDENGGALLFEQCHICIVCSNDLTPDIARQATVTLTENGGQAVIYEPPAQFPAPSEFTHIMSSTIDFPAYEAACDALIPVVKPKWMQASLSKRKLANPRQYSPDPRLFLNDVVVTCGDIPEGDKDAIIGGVLAKGGIYSSKVSQMVTHLVDLTADSDKAKLVISKRAAAKIVLPHWFDDCLKLGRRIDELPYTLPDPEILRAPPDAPVRWSENKDIAGASTPEPTTLPTSVTSPGSRRKLDVFEGKHIMLSPDLGIGAHLRHTIEDLITNGGGTITSDVFKTDMLICRYRDGHSYCVASRLNKDVGNLSWLYHQITYNTWTSPLRRMLHYPISRSGIPGFESLKISLSNYVGEGRLYLENLIVAAGAECTKTLKQDNTHLVTAHVNSEKCSAARDWGLHIVNHLWLEESYAKWKMQPVSDGRYTHFPKRTNLGEVVGQTRLDKAVLEKLFFPPVDTDPVRSSPRKLLEDEGKSTPATVSIKLSPTKVQKIAAYSTEARESTPRTVGKSRRSEIEKLQTPSRLRSTSNGMEIDTPSSTNSRKSKDTAAARLHDIAPDIALYEKEKRRVGGVIYGGRKVADEDRVIVNKKRRSVERDEGGGDDMSEMKRQKKSRPPVTIRLLVTRYQRWAGDAKREDADKRQLRDLGILILSDQEAKRCTHLAAPSILRTPKLVNAVAYAPIFVSVEFITQCLERDELLDPADFPLVDEHGEKRFGFSFRDVTVRARRNKNQLLQGYRIYCVESIRGGFDTYRSIVSANGGECMLFRGRVTMSNQPQHEDSDDSNLEDSIKRSEIYLLSSPIPDHEKLWPRFRQMVQGIDKTPRIVRVDWLLDIAMSQEMREANEYELTAEMVDRN